MTMNPKLGDKVAYIRNKGAENERGEGFLAGIGLDPDNIPLALIKNNEVAVNAPLAALNPSDEFVQKFEEMVVQIKALENEGNAKVKEIVEFYNNKILDLRKALLGESVEFK